MKSPITRIEFDPSNDYHRDVFYRFLTDRRWTVYFELEYPWLELPAMCSHKIHLYYKDQEQQSRKNLTQELA